MKFDPVKKVQAYEGVFDALPKYTPTQGEPDGPLCGNGDIGIVAGADNGDLCFWIGKNDLWYPMDRNGISQYSGGVRCMGRLRISTCNQMNLCKKTTFSARQKISDATLEIDLCTDQRQLHVSAYTPYQQNLIVCRIEARKGDIPLVIDLEPISEPAADFSHKSRGNTVTITRDYVNETAWDMHAAAVMCVKELNTLDTRLREGRSLTIVCAVYTNQEREDYLEAACQAVDGADECTLAQYRQEHQDWWNAFWATSGIEIPSEPELEKFWYASHYLMACCSKPGKVAPGIFGNWITTSAPNWGGDYHLNYNFQAPWWGVHYSNKVFLSEPYDQPVLDYVPTARRNAREHLGCRGIYGKVGIGPKGLEASRMFRPDGTEELEVPYWGQKSNTSYAAINMLMRFYSTWDRDYARRCVMPYLRELADFWEDYLKFEDGRYVIYNDCIHENSRMAERVFPDWDVSMLEDHSDDFNPILSLGLIRLVFKGLLDVSEYLGVDEERREKWAHILAHISDFPTQQRDGMTVFRYTERGMAWCDDNSLGIQHIFPAGTIGLSSDEQLLEISRNTVTALGRWADYNAFPTFFTAAARVSYDPGIILSKFKEQFLNHSFPNLFIYYGGGGIECCSAVPGCTNEMLFQSHENVLRFFPVWDKNKDAAFQHLRGYGAFVVSAALCGGVVQDVELVSEKGRPCAVLCPWDSGMEVLENGNVVACETQNCRDGVIYRFDTTAGSRYELRAKA